MAEKKKYVIQGMTFKQKNFTASYYKDSKIYLKLLDKFVSKETEKEQIDLYNLTDEFESVTKNVFNENDIMTDNFELSEVSNETKEKFLSNIEKNPEHALKLLNISKKLESETENAKELFLFESSEIENEFGVTSIIPNSLLLLQTFIEGETETDQISKINFQVEDDQAIELINTITEIQNDFFFATINWKKRFPNYYKNFNTLTYQTSLTFQAFK